MKPESHDPTPVRRRARAAAGLLAGALIGGLLAVGMVAPAQARVATEGAGTYLGAIDWFEWGEVGGADIPGGDTTRTNERTIGGQTLATTCTLSGVPAGELATYTSGSWFEDGLDDMYNIGGTGTANQLVAGIANKVSGAQVSFGFDCTVTLDGAPVPLAGLVFADAEASERPEHIEATTSGTWRLIDRHKSDDCDWNSDITRTGQTLRLGGREAKTDPVRPVCASFPTGVMFMEGSESADVTIKGRGVTAVALGVVLHTDFGDAPASYGDAGALYAPGYTGGAIAEGTQELFDGDLATTTLPGTRLGAAISSEGASAYSADASGDDFEDAASFPATLAVTPGEQYTLSNVACTGPGFVAGWIDWNVNGVFDDGERSEAVECVDASVDLTWTVPADAATGASFARLRIGPDAASVLTATGLSTAGEVEDYAVGVEIPALAVEKTSDATENTRPGDTVTYTVTATNTGESAFTDAFPAVVSDDLTGVLDDAVFNADAVADRAGSISYTEPRLSWSGALAAGDSMTLRYTATIGSEGDAVVRNVAFAGDGDVPSCSPRTAEGADPVTGVPCAATELRLPRLTYSKSSDPAHGSEVDPGDAVRYTLTFTNSGAAAAPVDAVDDLSRVLDDAVITSAVDAGDGLTAVIDGSALRVTGSVPVGETRTVSYTVTVRTWELQGDHLLHNVVTDAGGVCVERCDVDHPVAPPVTAISSTPPSPGLAITGAEFGGGILLGGLLLAGGVVLLILRRRHTRGEWVS